MSLVFHIFSFLVLALLSYLLIEEKKKLAFLRRVLDFVGNENKVNRVGIERLDDFFQQFARVFVVSYTCEKNAPTAEDQFRKIDGSQFAKLFIICGLQDITLEYLVSPKPFWQVGFHVLAPIADSQALAQSVAASLGGNIQVRFLNKKREAKN